LGILDFLGSACTWQSGQWILVGVADSMCQSGLPLRIAGFDLFMAIFDLPGTEWPARGTVVNLGRTHCGWSRESGPREAVWGRVP